MQALLELVKKSRGRASNMVNEFLELILQNEKREREREKQRWETRTHMSPSVITLTEHYN